VSLYKVPICEVLRTKT